MIAVLVDLRAACRAVALSALPVTQHADGSYHTQLADQYAGDPILGIVKNMDLGVLQTRRCRSTSASSPRRSC